MEWCEDYEEWSFKPLSMEMLIPFVYGGVCEWRERGGGLHSLPHFPYIKGQRNGLGCQ